MTNTKKWIQKMGMKEGALSRMMGIPENKNIPVAKLQKAAQASGVKGKRARLAITLKKIGKKKKKA